MGVTVPLVGTAAVIIENPPGNPSPVPFKLRLAWLQLVLGSSLCPAKFPQKIWAELRLLCPFSITQGWHMSTQSPVSSHSPRGALNSKHFKTELILDHQPISSSLLLGLYGSRLL